MFVSPFVCQRTVCEFPCTAYRNRTGTNIAVRGILSPLCLPISPRRHIVYDSYSFIYNIKIVYTSIKTKLTYRVILILAPGNSSLIAERELWTHKIGFIGLVSGTLHSPSVK